MKLKVKEVIIDVDYDCIVVDIDKATTQIVFKKSEDVKRFDGRTVELLCTNGVYTIKELVSENSK